MSNETILKVLQELYHETSEAYEIALLFDEFEPERDKQRIRLNVLADLLAQIPEDDDFIWIPIKKGETGYSAGDFRCSACGKPNKCYSLTEYCCNCGSKMSRRTRK